MRLVNAGSIDITSLEAAVLRAGLGHHDRPVLLVDAGPHFAGAALDQQAHVRPPRQDFGARLLDASWAERVGLPGKAERREAALPPFQEGCRRPLWLRGGSFEPGVVSAHQRPESVGQGLKGMGHAEHTLPSCVSSSATYRQKSG